MKPPIFSHTLSSLLIASLLPITAFAQSDWPTYGGNPAGTRYSTLTQINRNNVEQLRTAWTYDTGDAFPDSEMECQPIIVNGILYATTPKLRLIALDAATGKLRWQFDPNPAGRVIGKSRNRGVTFWQDAADLPRGLLLPLLSRRLDREAGARIRRQRASRSARRPGP
jgi:quinoprotein glucose dehydrogenase